MKLNSIVINCILMINWINKNIMNLQQNYMINYLKFKIWQFIQIMVLFVHKIKLNHVI